MTCDVNLVWSPHNTALIYLCRHRVNTNSRVPLVSAEVFIPRKQNMRNPRSATPAPSALHREEFSDVASSLRRSSLFSQHLPSLAERSLDCNALARIISPVFSPSEVGKTEIVELSGSPCNRRRGQLMKSALERRRYSDEQSKLPNLNNRQSAEGSGKTWSPKLNSRSPQYCHLRKTLSHPIISESAPSSDCDFHPRMQLGDEHSAKIRRHVLQENLDYDLFSTKAVILERYLNSQNSV